MNYSIFRTVFISLFIGLLSACSNNETNKEFDDVINVKEMLNISHTNNIYIRPSNTTLVSYGIRFKGNQKIIIVRGVYYWDGKYFNNTSNQELSVSEIESDACILFYNESGNLSKIEKKETDELSDIKYVKFLDNVVGEIHINNKELIITDYIEGYHDNYLESWENKKFSLSKYEYNSSNINLLEIGEFCFFNTQY